MQAAAKELYDLGAKHVVMKGGNRLSKERAVDVYYDGRDFEVMESPVLASNNTGAGCTFASSITSQLLLASLRLQQFNCLKVLFIKRFSCSDQYGVVQYEKSSS